jgi:hypothetical protein
VNAIAFSSTGVKYVTTDVEVPPFFPLCRIRHPETLIERRAGGERLEAELVAMDTPVAPADETRKTVSIKIEWIPTAEPSEKEKAISGDADDASNRDRVDSKRKPAGLDFPQSRMQW